MATTPRKAAAKPAARRSARSANPAAPAVPRVNILDELAVDGGEAVPVTLLGVEADIRRQFTGDEAATFFQHMHENKLEEMLAIVAGESGPALWEKVQALSPDHAAKALNRITNLSGLHEGKPFAPVPWLASPSQADGAPPSPESSAITA